MKKIIMLKDLKVVCIGGDSWMGKRDSEQVTLTGKKHEGKKGKGNWNLKWLTLSVGTLASMDAPGV